MKNELNNIVKGFWELTEEEQKCEALFVKRLERNKYGNKMSANTNKRHKNICVLSSMASEKDFYVDNGLTGAGSLRDAIELKQQLLQM